MGNHTATRARGRRGGSSAVREAAPSKRWRGGGQPMGDALLRPPTSSSPIPTVYASAQQRATVHQEARSLVGLAHESAVAIGTSGKRFYMQDGTRNEVMIPPEVLPKLPGQALLHNHPGGNSLSPADVLLGARFGVTMHVVGRPGGRSGGPIVLYTMRYAPLAAGLTPAQHIAAVDARAIRLDEMTKVMEAETESAYVAAIRAKTISARDASDAFFHQVWNAVADAFPADVSYSWEILPPDP